MAVRPDNRLLDAPMRPVRCRRCSAQVQVRKSSWQQTSVQWDTAAVAACVERRSAQPGSGPNSNFFENCSELRASIRGAAAEGLIPVPDDES